MYEVVDDKNHIDFDFPPLRLLNGGIDYENLEDWERKAYLSTMFQEAANRTSEIRYLQGPHYGETRDVLASVDEQLANISPGLKPEHLMPLTYQSDQAMREYRELGITLEQRRHINALKASRLESFITLGQKHAVEASDTLIQERVLDIPPYAQQKYDGLGCFRACFRMAFAGVTGSTPSEIDIYNAARVAHGTSLIHDEDFLNVFGSATFNKLYPDIATQVITITGADLDTIGKLSAAIKDKTPGAKVFCIVNLQTETSETRDIWHTNVLLEVTDRAVVTHDPSDHYGVGVAFRRQSKQRFHKRWAVAFNRAHLIVAA